MSAPLSFEQIRKAVPRLLDAARRRDPNYQWLHANVLTGIGVASRERNGYSVGEPVLRVHVQKKQWVDPANPRYIPPVVRVPDGLQLIPVDVIESGDIRCHDAQPGDSVHSAISPVRGTLGCVLSSRLGNRLHKVALTCAHVLPIPLQTDVYAVDRTPPGAIDPPAQLIGQLLRRSVCSPSTEASEYPNLFEVALVEVDDFPVNHAIFGQGPLSGLRMGPVTIGEILFVHGAESGRQSVVVKADNVSAYHNIDGRRFGFSRLVLYGAATPGAALPVTMGDSGAAILDVAGRLVGLHMGQLGSDGVMMPIAPIVREYRLGLPDAANGEPLYGDQASAIDTLARTIWGEARGEQAEGRQAVANVVINRVRRKSKFYGFTVEEVCRKTKQFSVWNPGNVNLAKMHAVTPADKIFAACLELARQAVKGVLQDLTSGSRHYHRIDISPKFAQGKQPVVIIGNHCFYNDVDP